jgi:hypothetical protein
MAETLNNKIAVNEYKAIANLTELRLSRKRTNEAMITAGVAPK